MHETTNNKITYRTKKEILDAAGYKGKPGAPIKINEPQCSLNVRIPIRIRDRIPHPRSESVRNALDFCITNGVF